MKRLAMLLLLFCGPVFADDVPLTVSGPGVKVVTVAESFPVTIQAPPGAATYTWVVPAGVTSTDKDDALDVTAAPPGPCTVTVRMATVVIDFEKKTYTIVRKTQSVTFTVGGVQPPPDPVDPEAIPSAALKKAMQDAYAAETDTRRADDLDAYAAFCGGIVKALKNSGDVKTVADFQKTGHAAANKALNLDVGDGQIRPGDNVLPHVRKAMADYAVSRLPLNMSQPTDRDFWQKAATIYSQGAQAMRKVVR